MAEGNNEADVTEVERVLKRLSDSVSSLETVVEGHLESRALNQDFAAEVQRMGADRTRLADSLDDAEARCQRLESVNREVSARLVNAMETIRGVLEKSDGT